VTDLFTHKDDRRTAAIYNVAHHIAAGTINRKVLNAEASALFGGANAEGRWTQRDSFELLEQGLIRHAITLPRPADTAAIAPLSAIVNALPTQTVRSEDQIRYQQFSTPLDLAGLVVLLGQAKPTDVVLEPSAGHGSLVALLPGVKSLCLNELDPKRREALQVLFPAATISGHDAAMLSATLEPGYTPSLILMNPPFSRSEGRGGDQLAAVRHLRSALSRLAHGGRVVAIMPDWFTTNAAMGKTYDATLTGCSVVGSYRLDKCYHKQGTSVAVRIYVIDKKPGHARPTVIARNSVAQLLDVVTIVPRSSVSEVRKPTVTGSSKPSLFKAMRSNRKAAPVAMIAPKRNDVLPVRFTALEVPRPLGEQAGVYLPYRPSRIDLHDAGMHPTDLVESVAMGSIPAPVPQYEPRLHERIVNERRLSEAQLETIVYAGNA